MSERQPGAWDNHPVLRRLVDAMAWVTWREVAIDDLAATARGPVVLVANHFGGVSDAIVLMSVLPRRPRVLADDQVWKVRPVGAFMDRIGAIPVHRGSRGTTDNTDMFASAHKALAEGETILIFPEGITREEPSIGKVRSGAARIAVGARAMGVSGIRIVPAGIHYDDKAAFRSSVFVREGEPIDVDAELAAADIDPGDLATADEALQRRIVKTLTEQIEQRLRASAPDYDDWREARALQTAAEAFMRSLEPERPVPVSLRDRLSSWLASREADDITEVADRYRTALDHLGVTDRWAGAGGRMLSRRRFAMALLAVLLVPYAVIGAIAWVVPMALTWIVSKVRMAPAVMATVMPLVALCTFGATAVFWLWFGWRGDGARGLVSFAFVLPIAFAAFVIVAERAALWIRWWRNRVMTLGGRGRQLSDLRETVVAHVADEVAAALGEQAASHG